MRRRSLSDLQLHGPLVDRENYISRIVDVIRQVIQTAASARESGVSVDEMVSRFIVLKGGAGVGKTILLEMLAAQLPRQVNGRVTAIIDVSDLIDNPAQDARWDRALEACAGVPLSAQSAAAGSVAMSHALSESGQPVIVLLDNLESLNNPLFRTGDAKRDQRILDVNNLLLRPLLGLYRLPVIVIAAARAMPDEPLPYLSEIDFQEALLEIPIVNQEAEVNRVLGITISDHRTRRCGDSLLVAAERGPNWEDPAVVRQLIDEFLKHEPAHQRYWFEVLLRALSDHPPTQPLDIKEKAEQLGLPAAMRQRIIARLVASSFLINEGATYRVYSPLASLLRDAKSYNR